MIKRNCTICGREFMAYGNTRTCSEECSHKKRKITQAEGTKRRKEKKNRKQRTSTLLEMQQKARDAGMSYGMYMAKQGMTD